MSEDYQQVDHTGERPAAANEELTTLLHARFDPSPKPEAFRLVVLEGPDQGQTFHLDGSLHGRVHVGCGEGAAFRVTDRTVSRRHIGLDVEGNRVRVTDLGSTNGTIVDGIAVVEALLKGGEVVRIGGTALRVERDSGRPAPELSKATRFGRVVGASTEMRRLYPLCEKLAVSDVPVIIEGEAGTGKELLAESLHEEGPRADKPFIVVDCSQVPTNLLEAELFGHEAGAVAGSAGARQGAFEQANGGTLFIDEIGELDLALQPKLLRALERREVRPIGGNRTVPVDVRVIASTRRDLDREVQGGRFREDLLQRLAVARIELPPLRRRKGDLVFLTQHFCQELEGDPAQLSNELRLSWEGHPWSGNVRELRNTVARHLALGELASLAGRDPDPAAPDGAASENEASIIAKALELPLGEARQKVVEEFERQYVERLLARHSGNVTRAAESAGVARRYFQIIKARSKKRREEAEA